MNEKQRTTIIRTILFPISGLAITLSILSDVVFRSNTIAHWFLFWTHLSNIGVFIWSGLILISLFYKDSKFEKMINSWYLKFTVTTFIVVTSTVFVCFALVPFIFFSLFINAKHGLHGITSGELSLLTITSTLFLHLIVPCLMALEFFTSPKSSTNLSKMSNYNKSMKLFIIPLLYLLLVLISTAYGVKPPYPVFYYSNPPTHGLFSTLAWQWFSFGTVIGIGAWFVVVAMALLKYEDAWKNRYYEKDNIEKTNKLNS